MNNNLTAHEFSNLSKKLIKEFKNNDFINLWDNQWIHYKPHDLTKVYQSACKIGNVVIVDYLLNSPLKFNIDFKFPYAEAMGYQEAIPNGAIFLAGEYNNIDLLEYFIKNDVYYIDSATTEGLKNYMDSVIDIIDKIELKLHIEDKLTKKGDSNHHIYFDPLSPISKKEGSKIKI